MDVIIHKTKTLEYDAWLEMFDDELMEIYSIEGADLDGISYENWVEAFYFDGGAIY
jgi:hypothetical protein